MSGKTDAGRIVRVLSDLLPEGAPLHAPEFIGNEAVFVRECLDSGWVSSVGGYVDRFEGLLADYTGAGHAVATVNGTAALHTCLLLAGVGRDDEVIVPALTFVAAANAVVYCGAHPHLADSDERTFGLDPARLDEHLADIAEATDRGPVNRRTGRRIAAVICVHTFGHPADLDALACVCERHRVPLIEDASESLGSLYKDRHTGTAGLLAALSFNGNKIITTGGGGAVLTNDEALAAEARHLTTTAKQRHEWEMIHDRTGYNYRMPNINAALGCAQMANLNRFVDEKRALAALYREAFDGVDGVTIATEPDGCRSNYWLNVLLLDAGRTDMLDDVLAGARDAGLEARRAWRPMHHLDMYRDCERMALDAAENLYRRIVTLPSSARLARRSRDAA